MQIDLFWLVAMTAFLLLVLAVGGVSLRLKRLARRVRRLSEAMTRAADGDLESALGMDLGNDPEAASFRRMVTRIRARIEVLNETWARRARSEKMNAVGLLIAGIAHQVKNPLTSVLSCAQLASDEVPPESSVFRDLQLIQQETRRSKWVIEELLRFAHPDDMEMTETRLNEVIEDSIAVVRHRLTRSGVRVVQDLQPDLPAVSGNAGQLQHVLVSLLTNAEEAIEGPGEVRVSSRLEKDGAIRVRLSDTGRGIPDDLRPRIFEPFFTTRPAGQGTGLELAASQGIVEHHQGRIEVESEVGVGTTFVVTLPVISATPTAPLRARNHAVPAEASVHQP